MHVPLASRLRFQASTFHPVRACAVLVALICAMPAFAENPSGDEPGEGPPAMSWSLGLGVASMQKPYAGFDRETKALPMLQFENRYIHVFGPQIGLKLPSLDLSDSQQLNFSIVGKYDGSGYESSDASILRGMSKRKSGFWAGAKVEWKNDLADVSAEWLADASGNSKGRQFSLGLERTWHFGNHVMLTPRVGATWYDKKYVDYYFGVRDSEVRADRPSYVGKSGVNGEVGVRGIYMFDRRHSMFLDVGVSSLAKEIKDSPLVDRSNESRVILGYLYRFQ
jgi:MipA family protein